MGDDWAEKSPNGQIAKWPNEEGRGGRRERAVSNCKVASAEAASWVQRLSVAPGEAQRRSGWSCRMSGL
jgi:hypothetical protein